jgi:hypothetical protein
MTYTARMLLIRVTWRAHREYALALARQMQHCFFCAQGDAPIRSSVTDKMVHIDATGHKLCGLQVPRPDPHAPFELHAWVETLSILNRVQNGA